MAELVWYTTVIGGVCSAYKAPVYVEIGIGLGENVRGVAQLCPDALIYGVDVENYSNAMPQNSIFLHCSSDYFFKYHKDIKADVIFVDGEHRYEEVSRDVPNALEMIKDTGVVIMHDTWPTRVGQLTGTDAYGGYLGNAYLVADEHKAFTIPAYPGLSFLTKWKERPFVLG